LGNFLVRQIDLLVAVWDGKPEKGIGGTAEVIRQAIALHVPIVWIFPELDPFDSLHFPRMIEAFEEDGTPIAPAVDCTKGPLKDAMSTIIAAPEDRRNFVDTDDDGLEAGPQARKRLSTFLNEHWPRSNLWVVYDLFMCLMARKPLQLRTSVTSLAKRFTEWDQFLRDAPGAENLKIQLREVLLPRYIWADQLAIGLANRYRSAYILCYLLSALAVLVALFGVWLHVEPGKLPEDPLFGKWILVSVEIMIIVLIVTIYLTGRRQRWHERWIEYRALAEMLRDSRFLAYLAEYGRIQRADIFESAAAAWFFGICEVPSGNSVRRKLA
jgi:hypothetical protein